MLLIHYRQIHLGLGLLPSVLDHDDVDRSTFVKKPKLTGLPYKIFKNATFIKDILSCALEVAKVGGANV